MALVVEDGTGLVNANAYVSVAEADAYIGVTSFADTWLAYTTTEKENRIILATRTVEQRTLWSGMKAVETSALSWPRKDVFDCNGMPVAPDVLPDRVKQATLEIVLHSARVGSEPNQFAGAQGIQKVVVDVVAVTYQPNFDATSVQALPRGLNLILCGLGNLRYSGSPGYAKINRV